MSQHLIDLALIAKFLCSAHQSNINPKYILKTVKHGGGNILVWTTFSSHGVGPITKSDTKMNQYMLKDILESQNNIKMGIYAFNKPLKWAYTH